MAALEQAVVNSDQDRCAHIALPGARGQPHARSPARRSAGLALVLLVAGLVGAGGSAALTLGNIEVRSALGQPFSGIARIEAAAGEVILRECFSTGAEAFAVPGIPTIADARFQLEQRGNESVLRIASRSAVREPLAQIILQVRCSGLPNITRSFLVMLDPALIVDAAFAPIGDPAPVMSSRPTTPRQASIAGGPIAPGSLYTVRPGDSLSGIASRIAGRPPYSVWPLAGRIKATNRGAFENGLADRITAGATLRIPHLDSISGSASRAFVTAPLTAGTPVEPVEPPPDQRVDPGSATASQLPLVIGTPLSPSGAVQGAKLEYLVLTPTLSPLSRSRIRQRAAITPPPDDAEPVATPAVPAAEVVEPAAPAAGSLKAWWFLVPAVLALIVVAVVVSLRRRETAVAEDVRETPWEVDEPEDVSGEMVYDDFEGTFVPKHPERFVQPAKDPEDEIQTHLMPALGEAKPGESDESGAAQATDIPGIETDELTPTAELPSLRRARGGQATSGLTAEEVPAMEADGDGWVDLDFEATQILEQDYLAEYAASLKAKVKEQSGEHEKLPTHKSGPDESEVLLEASDLMDALDEDPEETRRLELSEPADQDNQGDQDEQLTSELPSIELRPPDEEEAVTLTLEDNVVAIDPGQAKPVEDGDEQSAEKIKGSKKS